MIDASASLNSLFEDPTLSLAFMAFKNSENINYLKKRL